MSGSTKRHVSIDIKGALKQRDLTGVLADNGRELSDSEVRDVLLDDYRRGHDRFVGCDNRGPDGGCAGHRVEEGS